MRFHPAARSELREAIAYYKRIDPEIGKRFLAAVTARTRTAEVFPKIGQPVAHVAKRFDVRSHPIEDFDYTVFTGLAGAERIVIAVAHDKRRPRYWKRRLQ